MKFRQRFQRLRLAIKGGITIWKATKMLNEKQAKLVNTCTDHVQAIAEAVADYTETEKDDQLVRFLNPLIDGIQKILLEAKSGS